jgi:UTP:GlnB (protein PII) uridylyltransferase
MPTRSDIERRFRQSLPASYAEKYQGEVLAAHARVAAERGDALVNVGTFPCLEEGLTGICVVAVDRPGLLSMISAALVFLGLDVESAEAYTRLWDEGPAEAVDLFWVRHKSGDATRLGAEDVERLKSSLLEIADGRLRVPTTPPPPPVAESGPVNTRVRFLEDARGSLSTLEVETEDRSGLLMTLTRALFQSRVQIVYSEVRTVQRRVFDRFTLVELDGTPIGPTRRLEVQVAVLTAIERRHQAQQDEMPNL